MVTGDKCVSPSVWTQDINPSLSSRAKSRDLLFRDLSAVVGMAPFRVVPLRQKSNSFGTAKSLTFPKNLAPNFSVMLSEGVIHDATESDFFAQHDEESQQIYSEIEGTAFFTHSLNELRKGTI